VFHDYDVPCNPWLAAPRADARLQASGVNSNRVPSLNEIVQFFRNVYTKSQMEIECIIMSLIYLERLTKVRGRAGPAGLADWCATAGNAWTHSSPPAQLEEFATVCDDHGVESVGRSEVRELRDCASALAGA
jgi:hypothetical protein